MARGPKKSIEERIEAKQQLIAALLTRIESEKKELEAMYEEKRTKDLGAVNHLLEEAGLSTEEAKEALKEYLDRRMANAS